MLISGTKKKGSIGLHMKQALLRSNGDLKKMNKLK
jgi:hypothetical protein